MLSLTLVGIDAHVCILAIGLDKKCRIGDGASAVLSLIVCWYLGSDLGSHLGADLGSHLCLLLFCLVCLFLSFL